MTRRFLTGVRSEEVSRAHTTAWRTCPRPSIPQLTLLRAAGASSTVTKLLPCALLRKHLSPAAFLRAYFSYLAKKKVLGLN